MANSEIMNDRGQSLDFWIDEDLVWAPAFRPWRGNRDSSIRARGDGGKRIFVGKDDHESFLYWLERVCTSHGWRVHAWVLMGNHFHLLLEMPEANLVTGMRMLLGTFGKAWNIRRQRQGHVFQGRYKAVPVAGEGAADAHYFKSVADYIHLNPARAGLAGGSHGKLVDYPWSSLRHYPKGNPPSWQPMERVMEAFRLSKDRRGRTSYLAWLEARANEHGGAIDEEAMEALRRGWYLGEEGFKDKLLDMLDKTADKLRGKRSHAGDAVRDHHQVEAERIISILAMDLGRVETVTSEGRTATYRYQPTHQRVWQIDFSSGGSPFLYGSMTYDALLRLDRITYHNGQTTGAFKLFSDFRYTRDAYGNISSARRMDGTKNLDGYNPAGEVVADRKLRTAAGNEFLRGQSFRWSYDGIGNRLSASAGGDANGQNLRVSSYTPNALNQYAAIQNPGAADVIGVADGQAAVTINGAPATRQGDWFHGEVTADNSSGPVWQTTTASDGTDSNAGALLIPPVSQSPQHDLDGNLTSDGVHGYSWDGENRLIKIETLPSAVTAGVPYQRVEMAYDSQWRRIRRERFDQASTTTPVETTRYLWAGWRCLSDLGVTDSIGKDYVWGLDQAHQLHLGDSNNALLWTHDVIRDERHFCHYDGNGNVAGLSNETGNHTAEYLYNAFGVLTGKRGTYAGENDYRFSTKPNEEAGGLYYYGYRYLDPVAGRWMSRDPIGEKGGFNLHGFTMNSPLFAIDMLGLNGKELHLEFTINKSDALLKRGIEGVIGTAKSVSDIQEIAGIVSDLTGEGCDRKCVKTLTIWAHGSQGVIEVGNGGQINNGTIDIYNNHMVWIASNPDPAILRNQEKILSQQLGIMRALESIKSRLCDSPKVIINSCNSGFGPGGKELEDKLGLFFGFPIDLPGAYCSPAYITGIKYTNELGTIFDGPPTDREGTPLDPNKPVKNTRCCKKR
jgi:putative transposase